MAKKGFTIVELLVFIAVFALIIGSFITILVTMLNLQSNQSAVDAVSGESQYLIQQIQYYVNAARLVDMTLDSATTKINLREYTASIDPTSIYVSGGVVYLSQGSSTPIAFTSSAVSVSNFSVTRHYNLDSNSSAFGTDTVSYSFTMTSTGSTIGGAYSQSFQGSAAVLAPIPKIAMIQQAKVESALPSVTTMNLAYPSNVEAGDLLIAVVANTTSSASATLTDTEGNTWSLASNVKYPAYNTEFSVFYAANVAASSDAVTTTFTGGAGFASMFLYEYRGASTSSPFDASTSSLQTANSSPSSGSANATSSVELLLGVTHNATTAEIPSAGTGYKFETTSTVSDVFVEDADQFITGSVSAGWQYAGTPNSASLIATFH